MKFMTRVARGLSLAMVLGLATPAVVSAQDFGAEMPAGEDEGKPIFGYLAAGAGCLAIMFVVCMSARR